MDGGVHSLAVYQGRIVAGGWFSTAGGRVVNRVCEWDGSCWQPLGTGFDENNVDALAVWEDNLVAGGDFYDAGGVSMPSIARWDGTDWHAMGTHNNFGHVYALCVYDGDLVAAGRIGRYSNIARWDGSSWSSVGSGLSGTVLALLEHEGVLITGGHIIGAGGQEIDGVASWNGSEWTAMGEVFGIVTALAVHSGVLVAAIQGYHEPDRTPVRVHRWDGVAWAQIGPTLSSGQGNLRLINCLESHGGRLLAGGSTSQGNLLYLDGENWLPLAGDTNGRVWAICEHGGLVVAGWFTEVDGEPAGHIARLLELWEASTWRGSPHRGVPDLVDRLRRLSNSYEAPAGQ
jgi:hypothetical protein